MRSCSRLPVKEPSHCGALRREETARRPSPRSLPLPTVLSEHQRGIFIITLPVNSLFCPVFPLRYLAHSPSLSAGLIVIPAAHV